MAEGTARARQFVDTSRVDAAKCGGVLTGRRVRPMRADRQVERLRGSNACALLQANAIGHLAPPVSTRGSLLSLPFRIQRFLSLCAVLPPSLAVGSMRRQTWAGTTLKKKSAMSPPTPFAMRLRQTMAMRKVNNAELARRVGVEPRTVGNWVKDPEEDGSTEPVATNLNAICTALEVSADWLLGRTDHPCGLTPGSWVFDEDLVEAAKERRDAVVEPGFRVPRRPVIKTVEEADAIRLAIADARKRGKKG